MGFLAPVLMGAQIGIGLINQSASAKATRDSAREKYGAAMSAIKSLEEQKEMLGSIYENIRKPVVDRYGNALLKTTISGNSLMKKSNMAYSGTVENAIGLERANVKSQFSSQLMNIELQQANEEGAISEKIEDLRGRAAAFRREANYRSPTEKFFSSIGSAIGL